MTGIHASNFLIKWDKRLNNIPLMRIPVSLFNLFEKAVLRIGIVPKKIENSRYIDHIKNKSVYKCIALTIPVIGSLVILAGHLQRNTKIHELKKYSWNEIDLSHYRSDRDMIKIAIQQRGGRYLKYADKWLRDEKELVLEAVRSWGKAIKYASPRLQKDDDVKKAACQCDPLAIKFTEKVHEDEIEENLSPALKAFYQVPSWKLNEFFENLDESYKTDIPFLKAALKKYPEYHCKVIFQFADCWDDEEAVLELIDVSPKAFEHASEELRKQEYMIFAAVSKDGIMIRHAIGEARNKMYILKHALSQNSRAFIGQEDLIEIVYQHIKLFQLYVSHNPVDYEKLSDDIRNDQTCMILLVKCDPDQLKNLPETYQSDPEIVKAAFVGDEENKNFCLKALQYAHIDLRNDADFMSDLINYYWKAALYIGEELKKDPEFMQKVLFKAGKTYSKEAFLLVSDSLKDDKTFMEFVAEEVNKDLLIHATDRVKTILSSDI